jgi:hypothetical protein
MRSDHSKYYFKLIEKIKSSNLTVKEFCLQHSLNNKTYYYWKKKYETRSGKGFLPVVIDETRAIKAGTITIQYPDGTSLVFEGNADSSILKQFLPVFSK